MATYTEDRSLLGGLRVLDLSVWRPGPYATQLLADIGADVLKVEPPGGDPMRRYPALFSGINANKRSQVLDLKQPADRRRALELIRGADVVIEGFRPGVAARLGVGYDDARAVNPGVVYCSVSGLGADGPLSSVPGHDLNYQAWAGTLAPEGGEPVVPSLPTADLAGGVTAAFAICAAVIRKMKSGEGEFIDLAMTDVLATWTGAAEPSMADRDEAPGGRTVPGYGTFAGSDGRHLALGVVSEDHFWRSLCHVLGMEEHCELTFAQRLDHATALQHRVASAIADHERDQMVDVLLEAGVPVSPVLDRAGMLALEHLKQRKVVTADPWCSPAVGYPVAFRHHPAARHTPPPDLDQHHGSGFHD